MKNLHRFLILLFAVICSMPTWAQEVKFKSFTLDPTDLTAQQLRKKDLNGDLCALVKVQILDNKVEFEGDIIESSLSQQNEYWVWLVDGSTYLKVSPKNSLPLTIEFEEVNPEISEVKSGHVYDLVLSMPEAGLTFDTALKSAREHYENRIHNTKSSYYDAAVIAYDRAQTHIDCPADMIQPLRVERDTLRSIRKTTFMLERCGTLVQENAEKYGYESKEVYKYLAGRYKFANDLVKYHPEIEGLAEIKENALRELIKHPESKKDPYATEILKNRLVVTGKVTTQLSVVHVYACRTQKPKPNERVTIGTVEKDGTFSIIMPDGYDYIIFDGEKKAHPVSPQQNVLNVKL